MINHAAFSPGNRVNLQRRFDAFPGLTELVADRRTEDHAGVGDVHRRAGVLQTAGIDFDLRFGGSVSICSADHRQIGRQRPQLGMKQRREARYVHNGIESQLDGLTEDVAGALHVGGDHLRGLARVGGDQGRAVHDGVASGQRLAYRLAVFDVPDDQVRHVDAQFGDGRLQLRGSSYQEADRVARVSNGLGGPTAYKSRAAGD